MPPNDMSRDMAPATRRGSPFWWARIGRQMGLEHALLDRLAGIARPPECLPMPPGTPAAYRDALREGYQAGITGQASAL